MIWALRFHMNRYQSFRQGLFLFLFVLLGTRIGGPITAISPQADGGQSTTVQNLVLAETGLHFTLNTPVFSVDDEGLLTAPGLSAYTSIPGAPAIPFYSTYIVLPPNAAANINLHIINQTTHTVPTLQPAPSATLPPTDSPLASGNILIEDLSPETAIYQTDTAYPPFTYTLSDPQYVRDIRLVKLSLYPFQYNPTQNTLTQTEALEVDITFTGSDFSNLHPAPGYHDNHLQTIAGLALNAAQASQWRSLPANMGGTATVLPEGQVAFKLALSQDGIYEVTYATLGMSGSYNPATIQMVYNGQTVATEFVNRGGTSNFDSANDAVRFYGWAFNGTRHDQQYVTDNIFWLWVGGTATSITTINNPTGFPTAASFPETITHEQNNRFTSTFVPQELWFYNETDSWYWDLWSQSTTPITKTYTIDTPNPVTSSSTITFTTEILSRGTASHLINSYLNYGTYGSTYKGTNTWSNNLNVNVVGNASASALVNGTNQITIGTHSSSTTVTKNYLLNRLTIEYQRQFIATSDQLIFTHNSGSHQYSIQGYSQNNAANVLVWNISNPYQPTRVPMTAANISGSGPYTYSFGSTHASTARFIATTNANIINLSAAAVENYLVPNLNPPNNQAEWLAISHSDFMPAVNQLATHRQAALYGAYQTHVVDIQDIIYQYGYGLETPSAIHNYLAHALANWQVAPSYVLLVGDASADVRHIWVGNGSPTYWDENQISYVNTDMLIIDRFQGLIPTDYSFVLLAGNDNLADMAIGRLAGQSLSEVTTSVAKIIQYEQNHLSYLSDPTNYAWLENILFTADEFDPDAGDFCSENEATAAAISAPFTTQEMCLGNETGQYTTTALMRAAMKEAINNQGITLLNYRGHGSIDQWAGDLLQVSSTGFWFNSSRPVIALSMDCLDAHFIFPGFEGLGETIVGQPTGTTGAVGAAAHWSSTGLGLTSEHSYLAHGFYDGLLDQGLTAIGDAILYGKLNYALANLHYSELYSFTLHGDPALQLYRPAVSLDLTTQQTSATPGATVTFTLSVNNTGLYPTHLTVVDTLPTGLNYVTHSVSVAHTVDVAGNQITFTLEPPFLPGDTATITLTTLVASTINNPVNLTNQAVVTGTGLEGDPGNENDSVMVQILIPTSSLYLPLLKK